MSDSTDPGGVTGGGERGARNTRTGNSGSPVGSALTIVLAVIAVAAGFLIFRSISDGSNASGVVATTAPVGTGATAPGATDPSGGGATTVAPVTTVGGRITDGATVIVANASAIPGSAQRMTDELEAAGYAIEVPTDDNSDEPLEATVVHFAVGTATEAVAQSVARDLGNAQVLPMPDPIPTADGALGTATVLVLLGTDTADQTLDELEVPTPPAAPAAATTAPATG